MKTARSAYRNVQAIGRLDPEKDYLQIYQLTALYDFADDMRYGLNLAFYRTFAVPRIAGLLAHTGVTAEQPVKRSYDTALVMYELICAGFEDQRGDEMVQLLDRVHSKWSIAAEDFLYVLCTFIVVPTRWIERRGWRPLLQAERTATLRFYRELGRRMNIDNLPNTYNEAVELLDAYEAAHLTASPAGTALMNSTLVLFRNRLPKWLQKHTAALVSALIEDRVITSALGLPKPQPLLVGTVRMYYRIRNLRLRRRPAAATSIFTPGQPMHDVYPNGYQLHQLGPSTFS